MKIMFQCLFSSLFSILQSSGLKPQTSNLKILTSAFFILTSLLVNKGWGQTCPTIPTTAGTHTITFNVGNNCTFTIPSGVTSIKVQAWGGGGSGGQSGSGGGGGGGAGGNYAQKNSISVTGGVSSIQVSVGSGGSSSAGGQSSVKVGSQSWVEAEGGGIGGNGSANSNGAGGTVNPWRWCHPGGNGICDVSSLGGQGSCGPNSASGGGGGEGGCSSGSNGAGMTSCGSGGGFQSGVYGTTVCDGGNGGGGATSATTPFNGNVPGGGGGGRYKGNTGNGGNGGGGRVIITYTIPACTAPTITAQPSSTAYNTCVGGTVFSALSVTASGTGTLTYQWQSCATSAGTYTDISNATLSSYTPVNTAMGTLYYKCKVTGDCGNITSNYSGAYTVWGHPKLTSAGITSNSDFSSGANTSGLTINGQIWTWDVASVSNFGYTNAAGFSSTSRFIQVNWSAAARPGGVVAFRLRPNVLTAASATPANESKTLLLQESADGTTWTNLQTFSWDGITASSSNLGSTGSPVDYTYEYTLASTSRYIKFTMPTRGTNSGNFLIDNLIISDEICAGNNVSATFGAGSGTTATEYSINNGSTWSSYTSGSSINTSSASAAVKVRSRSSNVTCTDGWYTYTLATITALPTITASSGASRCGAGTLGISATASAGSIEWFNAASSGTSQGTSNSGATWTTPSISPTTNYYAEAVNGSCRSAARIAVTATVNTAAYRSFGTGNWSDATKWEISCDGTNWTAANVAPGSGDGAISIRNGHNIIISTSITLDELTIDEGATLTVNGSQTLTIANGTGDDLTVNGSLIINGTISNSGSIKLNSGGLYNHANGTSIPAGITFSSGSTLEVSSSATCTNIHSYSSRPHHLTWSSSGAMPTGTTSSGDALTLCSGDFTLSNGSFLANNNGSGSNYSTVSIGGNLNLSSSGILRVIHNSNGSNSQGVGQINISGNFNMTGGTFDFSNSANATTGAKLNISGDFIHRAGSITATTQPSAAQINLTGTSGTQIIESIGQSCSLTFNVAGSNAQCVVAATKTFVLSANTTFIVASGTSTPDLLINGTFTRTGTSLTTSGTMSVGSGGTYQHNCNGQSLPSASWDAASTCNITGTSSTTPTNFGQTFGNLTVNCSGTATTDANSTVAGNLTITGGLLTVGNNFTFGITGNSSITGTLTLGGTGAKTFTGNTTINSSGTLNASGSGAYSIAGNFTNNGTFTPGTAILTLNGGGAQTIAGTSALSFSNVTINKTGGTLTAQKDMTITGTLTLTNGILDMNGKILNMGTASANGTITGGSASSYIVALDGGTSSKLIHRVNSTSNSTYSFPIGTGSKYTPVTIVMKGGTLSNATIQVWTKNSKVTGMSDAMSCQLNRSWFVEPTGITSPTYDIQLGFASGDFSGDTGFDLNPVKLSSGVWYKPSGSLLQSGTIQGTTIATSYASPSTPTTSSGTVYWNGLASFSEFGGGGGSAPLPVELVSFSGSCEDGIVNLSWQTASEFNSSHFDVEKSRDGENWQVIETIPAAGNSNELLNYEAFDQVTNILNYYRLNQVDIDGTNKRYNPIAVSCEASQNGIFITYPNPSNEGFNILINDKELEGEMNMNIFTSSGSIALHKRIVVKEGINVFMMNEKLLPGLYFIELKDQNNITKVIKHLVN